MRGARLSDLESLPIDVLPIGTDYPPDHLLARHEHRRAQLLYGGSGTMLVATDEGSWTIPADRAVLIPPGVVHEVRFLDVTTWSLYIEPDAVPWWPSTCTVVDVDPLLRELLRTADQIVVPYEVDGRDGAVIRLILHEVRHLAPVPLHIALPSAEPFRALCRAYLADPSPRTTNAQWASASAMSERTLDRRFRDATGSSPAAWRTRARLLASLPLLRRSTVAETSGRLGYATPAAFTAAFTRTFGTPPSSYR